MVSFTDWYDKLNLKSGDRDFAPVAVVERAPSPTPNQYIARLIGWRERQRMIYEPIVVDQNGDAITNIDVDIVFRNGATRPVGFDQGRGVDTDPAFPGSAYQFGEVYTTGMNIPIGPGSKIQEGQPQGGDIIWIRGILDGKSIISDVSITGLYSSDIIPSPIFRIKRVKPGVEGPPPAGSPPPAPPTAGQSGIVQRLQLALSLVSGAITELSR